MRTLSGWQPVALCAVISGAAFGLERLDPFPEDRFLAQPSPQTLPSTRIIPPRIAADGIPLMSLVIDRDSLHSPEHGLITHPTRRGREWERTGYVSYFDGRLKLATKTGVRLHGGDSRLYSRVKSFRLYFRPGYGAPALPSSIFFRNGPQSNLTRVIAHNDVRTDGQQHRWHLVNPLAYDIAARLGGIVPRTQPTRFYLNGEPQGVYVLTEHISPEFLEARFGHSNFEIQAPGDRTLLYRWATRTRPFTMAVAETVVDLDNLTSWALTILFCATTDVMSQSHIVKDQSDPAARFFWITWDLDHSFMDRYQSAPEHWLLDSYQTLLYNREARSQILTRLLRGDDAYRRYFAVRLAAALNHQLAPVFLEERYWHYFEAAKRGGADDTGYSTALLQFLRERPRALWDLTVKHLKTKAPVTVTVSGPQATPVEIDGFRETLPYTGTYLPGTPFVLDAKGASGIEAWRVNGVEGAQRLSFDVHEHVRIEAIARQD
jgi:hypothetical protein